MHLLDWCRSLWRRCCSSWRSRAWQPSLYLWLLTVWVRLHGWRKERLPHEDHSGLICWIQTFGSIMSDIWSCLHRLSTEIRGVLVKSKSHSTAKKKNIPIWKPNNLIFHWRHNIFVAFNQTVDQRDQRSGSSSKAQLMWTKQKRIECFHLHVTLGVKLLCGAGDQTRTTQVTKI